MEPKSKSKSIRKETPDNSKISTGTGAFAVDGQIVDYGTYDVTSEPSRLKPMAPSKGAITIDDTVKDLSKKTKVTLGQYLSDATKTNVYQASSDYQEIALTDSNGNPSVLKHDSENTKQYESDSNKLSGQALQGTLLNTEPLDTPLPLDPTLDLTDLVKGKSSLKTANTYDGNTLLQKVSPASVPKPITNYVTTVLKNNRFSSEKPSTKELETEVDYNVNLRHPRYGSVSLHQLATIGTSLSLRGSQELLASNANNDPTSTAQELAALLPGANQLGISRIKTTILEAADVLQTITRSDETPKNSDFTNVSDLSWGALNNVDDQYSGIQAFAMIPLSMALTAAITLLIDGLSFIFGALKGGSGTASRTSTGRYIIGRNKVAKTDSAVLFPPNFGALLGLRNTIYPYGACVRKGVLAFFGLSDPAGAGGLSLTLSNIIPDSPGFNVIVARSIIRSSSTIFDSIKKLGKQSNVVSGARNILAMLDVIKSSKIFAAANVFAGLGDQILTDPGDVIRPSDSVAAEPLKKSRIDGLSDDVSNASMQKNRLNNTLKLAWAQNRAPAMYLVPNSLVAMGVTDNSLGGFKGVLNLTDPKSNTRYKTLSAAEIAKDGARIARNVAGEEDTLNVKEFEKRLDAEYMPFSFHDLRTNEIISCHAFLASLTDGYAVGYETTEGFGRVESIEVYKNTKRSIGLSFYLVATSQHDFDDMWVKINKLTTMLYPQYTRGHLLSNPEQNLQFVQPFSQLIGASPMIRLRLGDLIRSNYTRFALARLFGVGGNETLKFGKDATIKPFELAKVEEIKKTLASPDSSIEFNFVIDGWMPTESRISFGTSSPTHQKLEFDQCDSQYIIANVKIPGDVATVSVKLQSITDIVQQHGLSITQATQIFNTLKTKYANKSDLSHHIVDAVFTVPMSCLKVTQKSLNDLYAKKFPIIAADVEKISTFLDIKDNAIVRSFNSTQGKGLAGFIKQMDFDWYDKVTWEITPGSTAPKMCKITMQFNPIHDISPGIDHMGYNRAPIYPVGSAMKSGRDPERSKT